MWPFKKRVLTVDEMRDYVKAWDPDYTLSKIGKRGGRRHDAPISGVYDGNQPSDAGTDRAGEGGEGGK